jgi:autotransporter-associated beta strand protein
VNTYTGTTTIASGGGALRIDAVSALPAGSTVVISKGGTATGSLVLNTSGTNVYTNPFGTFASSNGLANGGTPGVQNLQGDNTLTADMTIAGAGGNGMNFTSEGGLLTLAGTLSNAVASSTRTLGLGGAGNGQVTGPIVDGTAAGAATNVVKSGAGTWSLTNPANSFIGTPTVLNGVLDAASIADSGVASALGAGSTIQLSGQGTSGTLRYTGATDQATNRTLQIAATGGAIDSSGAGALTVSSVVNLGVTQTWLNRVSSNNMSSNNMSSMQLHHGSI